MEEAKTTLNKVQRFQYTDGVAPVEDIEYFFHELDSISHTREIVLLLCSACDILDNILEHTVEEKKDSECRKFVDLALQKLELCEKEFRVEFMNMVLFMKEEFLKYKENFVKRH